jgi:hypothetical protein
LEFEIGTNLWKDATGVFVQVGGKEQVKLETRDDSQLLLSADIYNVDGLHVAKLNRNFWVFNNQDYAVTTQPTSLSVSDRRAGTVLFAEERIGPNRIKVHPCEFYTPKWDSVRGYRLILQCR